LVVCLVGCLVVYLVVCLVAVSSEYEMLQCNYHMSALA
jgi:hypothetical protein